VAPQQHVAKGPPKAESMAARLKALLGPADFRSAWQMMLTSPFY